MSRLPSPSAALLGILLTLVGAAGVYAQTEAPVLTVTGLDAAGFPYVVVDVKVQDSAGRTATGLTAADFSVTEDGFHVGGPSISLETVQGDPISLVLAVDASVDWQSFNLVRSGARALVEALGPEDQVAIVVFSETVDTALDFTPDKQAALATLDSIVATGVFTVLNDAALRAVALAQTAPTHDRAVLLITNSGDRSGDSSATEAVTAAKDRGTPIFTVGYGRNAATSALAEIASQTGGQSLNLDAAADVPEALPALAGEFSTVTYRLTFYSSLRADNQPHTVTVGVTLDDQTAESTSNFVAVSRGIDVRVPGIQDGQAVVGKVYLVTEVDSASPIVLVEYLLNGQPIATVTTPPYSFEWDSSTVNNGSYELTVRATDAVGNQGEQSIVVTVTLPFVVQITADTNRVQVGDTFVITADVQTPAQIAQVELLVDGQVVATDTTTPFAFELATDPFEPGSHEITVRAVDTLGRSASSSLPVQFTQAWLPIVVRWTFATLIGIAIIVTLIVGLAMMGAASRAGKRKQFRTVQVELINTGNTRTRYELRADDPASALAFEFGMNGAALPQRQVIEAGQGGPAATKTAPAGASRQPAPAAAAASGGGQGPGAMSAAKGFLGLGRVIGGMLSSVGYLLPGSIGQPMINLGYQLRGGEYAMSRMQHEAGEIKDLAGGGRMARQMHAPMPREAKKTPAAPGSAPTAAPTAATGIIRMWAQTPPVDPGQALALTLTLRPIKGAQSEPYFFRVVSQAVDVADLPPVIEQGHIRIRGLSIFQRLLPFGILLATLAVMAGLVVLLVSTVGLFG